MAVLCWYDSHHFWINNGRLKCIPRLYATTLQRLHSYNVLVVSRYYCLSGVMLSVHKMCKKEFLLSLFTQPPMRLLIGGSVYVLQMFFSVFRFFLFFFRPQKNMRQPFSGTAERIFMKLLPNDTGENGVCNVVPPPGEC